jgi:hypothetical protein
MCQEDVKAYRIPSSSRKGALHADQALLQGLSQEVSCILQWPIPQGFEQFFYRYPTEGLVPVTVQVSPRYCHCEPCRDRV